MHSTEGSRDPPSITSGRGSRVELWPCCNTQHFLCGSSAGARISAQAERTLTFANDSQNFKPRPPGGAFSFKELAICHSRVVRHSERFAANLRFLNFCPGRPVRGFFFREIARPPTAMLQTREAAITAFAKSWRSGLGAFRYSGRAPITSVLLGRRLATAYAELRPSRARRILRPS